MNSIIQHTNLSHLMKNHSSKLETKMIKIGFINIYIYLNKNSYSELALIATTTNKESLNFINYIEEYEKLKKYKDINDILDRIDREQNTNEDNTNRYIIGFCRYDIEEIYVINKEFFVKIYLSRLWSYIKDSGIGLYLMCYGYELIKHYINYNKEYREKIISNSIFGSFDLLPEDIPDELLESVRDYKLYYGIYDFEEKNKIRNLLYKCNNIKFKFIYTFHDSSKIYGREGSFYDFLIIKDEICRKGLIYPNKERIKTTDENENNSYMVKSTLGNKEAYYIIDEDIGIQNIKDIYIYNLTYVNINYIITKEDILSIDTLYNMNESVYYRFRV